MVEGDIRVISNNSVRQQTVTIANSSSNMMDQRGERVSTPDETLTCFQYNSCWLKSADIAQLMGCKCSAL